MWQYLYLIVFLRLKDETEMNGIETFVWDAVEDDEVHFFPLHKVRTPATARR